ncbi:MAG: hypothetical protein L3K26_19895, partial [Candidatus Hydrogenedentes bacterium]|nr:hypothetical protein [Candidatus Hydrogenedentota bacterium]
SSVYEHAEGWRRHSHLGFCSENADPLSKALGEKTHGSVAYERDLDQGMPEPPRQHRHFS